MIKRIVALVFCLFISPFAFSQACDYPDGDFEEGPSAWPATWTNAGSVNGNGTWFQEGTDVSSGPDPWGESENIVVDGSWSGQVRAHGCGTPSACWGILSTGGDVILESGAISWIQLDENPNIVFNVVVIVGGNVVWTGPNVAPNAWNGMTSSWAGRQATIPSNFVGVPVRVGFRQASQTPGSGWFSMVDNVCIDIRPTVKFDIPQGVNATRVLIHKHGSGSYPNTTYQTADRLISIKGTAYTGARTLTNRDVYMRVIDPPDSSLYSVNPHIGDNQDKGDATAGTLICGNPPSYSTTCTWRTDAQGVIRDMTSGTSPILKVTNQYSGDNYLVEAGFDAGFGCSPNCSKTGILTAWKRAYIESLVMWRQGEFITQNSGNGSGKPATEVFVANPNTFRKDDDVFVFSANNTIGEVRRVKAVSAAKKKITLYTALNGLYAHTVVPGTCDPANGTFNAYCANTPYSFVARVAAGVYDVSPGGSASFDDTFVEWKPANSSPRYLPSWPNIPFASPPTVANFIYMRTQPFISTASLINHIAVISAGTHAVTSDPLYGATNPDLNFTAVFGKESPRSFQTRLIMRFRVFQRMNWATSGM